MPHHPGDGGLCGPAVLAMLAAAAGRRADVEALATQVYVPGRGGSLQVEMLAAARRQGLLAVEVAGGWPAVARELEAGHPVAMLVNLALPWWPRWHYLLLTGLDGRRGEVRVHSGDAAHDRWTLTTLDSTWARSGRWAFVAPPPRRMPATADEAAMVRALLALDRVASPSDAAAAWSGAAARWPGSVTVAVGEANAWQAAGDGARAEQVLAQRAASLDRAVLWNNLAQLRLQRGDREGARAAAQRALQRAEAAEPRWLETVRRTLAESAGR